MSYRFPFFAKDFDRRTFLKQAARTGLALAFVGCGKGGPGDGGDGGGGGGNPPGETSLTSAPPVSVSGAVDAKQIGGNGLSVLTSYRESAAVTDGTFQSQVSSGLAQVVFVRDAAGQLRGLALSIPSAGVPVLPTIDAASTAAVLVFMSPGIVAVEAAESRLRLEHIQAAAAFPALVAALAERLPGMPVPAAVAEVQPQLEAAITEVHSGLSSIRPQLMFRTPEDQAAIDRNGGIYLVEDREESNAGQTKLTLYNEGWRLVELRRQHFSTTSSELLVAPAHMSKTFYDNSRSVLQGVNGFSIGNLFTGQIGQPGSGEELVNHSSDTSRVVYWAHSMWGNPNHPNNTPLPISVQLPNTEGDLANKFTLFTYLILPMLEPVLSVAGLAKMGAAEAIKALGLLGVTTDFTNLRSSMNTGDSGNVKSAMIDLAKTGVVLAGGALGTYLGGVATLSGFVATAAALVTELVAGMASAANVIAATSYYLRVPQTADIEHKLLGPASLERLGSLGSIQVLDISAYGAMAYNVLDSAPPPLLPGCFFKKYGSSPVRLLDAPGEAQVNDKDSVLYQDQNHSLDAVFRAPDGQTVTIRTPTFGFQAKGVVALSPEDHVFAVYYPNEQPEIYTYTTEGYRSLGPLSYPLRTDVPGRSGIGRAGKTRLFCSFQPSSSSAKGVMGSHSGGAWFYDVRSRGSFLESFQFIDVNSKDEALILETEVIGDSFQGYSFTHILSIEGPGGKRTVARDSDGPPDGDGSVAWRVRTSAVGLNDEGEVAGSYTFSHIDGRNENKGVLWSGGQRRDISSLLPANAPAGMWFPVLMKGRFMVLNYTSPDGAVQDVYLFYRGRV